jgi:hypothetical protein
MTARTGVCGADDRVQTSTTLAADSWTNELETSGGVTITGNDVKYTFPPSGPVKKAARCSLLYRLCASQKNFLAQRRKAAKFFRIKISRLGGNGILAIPISLSAFCLENMTSHAHLTIRQTRACSRPRPLQTAGLRLRPAPLNPKTESKGQVGF